MKPLAALFLLAMVAYAISSEYGSVSFTPEDGMILPMEIELKSHSMLSIPSKPKNLTGCFHRTINYHDLDRGLVALKEIQRKKCLVKPTRETYEESKKLLEEFKDGTTEPAPQAIEKWTIPKNSIQADKVSSKFGGKIAKFCAGHQVYRLKQRSVLPTMRLVDKNDGASSRCWWACGSCSMVMVEQH